MNEVIDCDTVPLSTEEWSIEEHHKGGMIKWDAMKVELYLHDVQKRGAPINGNRLCKELRGKSVLNANVLSCLLKNQPLVPKNWRGKEIFFFGTVYRHRTRGLYVRGMRYRYGGWRAKRRWLIDRFGDRACTALWAG